MYAFKMTRAERLAVLSLSSIMSLRMIGLFMVLPVFSLYAYQLSGATPFLIGIAMGTYGLAQALFQIPFGALSDRFGRKPIILIGLLIFIAGSLIAGSAHSITTMIAGRSLQGVGAVGSTILAFMADLTRENQRTKSMAIAGITIGFSFSLAMFIGPILMQWLPTHYLFYLAALCGAGGIVVLYSSVPTPATISWHRDTEPELKSFKTLLVHPELAKLNSGIFILHALFTASFCVIPISLAQFAAQPANQQWKVYLPSLLLAFILSLVCIGLAERKQQIKPYFLLGISLLVLAELLLWLTPTHLHLFGLGICLFFTGFSLLEAFLPSLVSRTAPAERKGSALGIYSCAQFFGIFVGGVLGGWLYGKYSFSGVYLFCIMLALFWLILAYLMQAPRFLVTQLWRIDSTQQSPPWDAVSKQILAIPGVAEATFIAEDGIAYLKVERKTLENPDFIRLKEQLQSRA
jgi:MFS family permease